MVSVRDDVLELAEQVADESPVIDHDHQTGIVRALLCRQCNAALGQFAEDVARIRGAADYLESF